MAKFIGIWIYFCGLAGSALTGAFLFEFFAAFPSSQVQAYGPYVPQFSRMAAAWLPNSPGILWAVSGLSAVAGLYLWRSNAALHARLFAAAVIAAINCSLAMFFQQALLVAYFYGPRIANGA